MVIIDRRELKRLRQVLHRKGKALAEALLIASKEIQAYWGKGRGGLTSLEDRRQAFEILDAGSQPVHGPAS